MSPTLRPSLRRPVAARPAAPAPRVARPAGERRAFRFFREIRSELGKVTWPSREHAQNLTIVVIAVSVAVGVFLGVVDWLFAKIFEILLRLV